ncbi:hypothetical protein GCM10027276_42750 [Comamonas piscis]
MSYRSSLFGLFNAPRVGLAAVAVAVAALLAACSPDGGQNAVQAEAYSDHVASAPAPAATPARMTAKMARMETAPAAFAVAAAGGGPGRAAATDQRFLAISHRMQIEAPAADLADLWSAVKSRCEALDCYVETSDLRRETPQSSAEALLTMRVAAQDFAALTEALGTGSRVLNHQTSTEDKSFEVVDVEAQIKNRTEYRDSLRALLLEKNVKRTLQDLMAIRDMLSQVQAEIDAASSRRALLERDTAKQLVHMRFQPTRAIVSSGSYSPWQQTWQHSWDGLTRSMQSLILTAAQSLPWLLALALVVLLPLRFAIKRWMRRSAARAQVAHKADTKS